MSFYNIFRLLELLVTITDTPELVFYRIVAGSHSQTEKENRPILIKSLLFINDLFLFCLRPVFIVVAQMQAGFLVPNRRVLFFYCCWGVSTRYVTSRPGFGNIRKLIAICLYYNNTDFLRF